MFIIIVSECLGQRWFRLKPRPTAIASVPRSKVTTKGKPCQEKNDSLSVRNSLIVSE